MDAASTDTVLENPVDSGNMAFVDALLRRQSIRRIRSAPVRPELVVKLSVMRWLAQLDLHLLSSEASVKQGYEQIAQRFVMGQPPETSVRLDEDEKFFQIAAVFIPSMLDWAGQSRWELAMADLREKSALGSGWAKGNL
ncbi:uncharacterized protein CLUP02_09470 [Colletotrichum lupini]|uniref:Uncharacterized protein n=1 Tax=Colletotrichum lupini TaxID=145971 RepID=A0A9Q8SUW8_9PEZI|nr:uncharacterized protein CLUP02_09470 [Colletotrichum lupini]UQC83974.1 hypothetical protein CLUP02_09470 [Colletotrichum lupini]